MGDALAVVKGFIERINARDVEGICARITEDHTFLDAVGASVTGAEHLRTGWKTYFSWFPDYTIHAEHFYCDGDRVAVFGRASGTYAPDGQLRKENSWEIPAAWQATVRGDRIATWRVYADNQAVRNLMQPPAKSSHG